MEDSFHDMLSPVRNDARHSIQENMLTLPSNGDGVELTNRIAKMETSMAAIERWMTEIKDLVMNPALVNGAATVVPRPVTVPSLSVTVPARPPEGPTGPIRLMQPVDSNTAKAIPDAATWEEVVKQWKYGDPSKGLHKPLSSWSKIDRARCSTLYNNRQCIGREFERLKDAFSNTYKPHLKSFTNLMKAIRANPDNPYSKIAKENAKARAALEAGQTTLDGAPIIKKLRATKK
jgi:hypothetical protein